MSRDDEQQRLFKQGLDGMHVLYACRETWVWRQTRLPPGESRKYEDRGWCVFERLCASLIKHSNKALDLSFLKRPPEQIVDFPNEVTAVCAKRRPPMTPEGFREALQHLTFTSGADSDIVLDKYRVTFTEVMSAVDTLDYSNLGWGPDEALQLSQGLAGHANCLRILDLSKNPLQLEGMRALAADGVLPASLEQLILGWGRGERSLQASVSVAASPQHEVGGFEGWLMLQTTKKPAATPAYVTLTGYLLRIEATGRRTKMLDLRRVADMRSIHPGEPAGAFELKMHEGFSRRSSVWYQLSGHRDGADGALRQWLELLASAVPDRAVSDSLRGFRSEARVLQLMQEYGAQPIGVDARADSLDARRDRTRSRVDSQDPDAATEACSACGHNLQLHQFSQNQLKKGSDRRCKRCVAARQSAGESAPVPLAAPSAQPATAPDAATADDAAVTVEAAGASAGGSIAVITDDDDALDGVCARLKHALPHLRVTVGSEVKVPGTPRAESASQVGRAKKGGFFGRSKKDSTEAASVSAVPAVSAGSGSGEPVIEMPKELPKVCLEDFDLLNVLGKGGFGKVMLVRKKGTTDIFAMKVLKKEAVIRRNQVAHTKTETHILKQIRHPFLTRMHYGVCWPRDASHSR